MNVPEPLKKAVTLYDETSDFVAQKLRERVGYFDMIRVIPYRGYGTPAGVHLRGRVLADDYVHSETGDTTLENIINMMRRYGTDEVPGAKVSVRVHGREFEVETDEEGFYELELTFDDVPESDDLWHTCEAELLSPHPHIDQDSFTFEGEFQVPREPRFGIISDIDDTIMKTGATDFFRHARIVMTRGPHGRIPFPGVAELYTALQNERQLPTNPIWYVSSSPWNLYELFTQFMEINDIPAGSIFLKDFGFDEQKFIKSGHQDYKRDRITRVLDEYPELPFILIGDSGQKDAEIYREIVRRDPDRIAAVYVRDVGRDSEVREIAEAVGRMGVDMLLVEDTAQAAEHAFEQGWLERPELDRIRDSC